MNGTKRQYKATFILDTREQEDSVEAIVESMKEAIAAVQGEVKEAETLGKHDFARVTNKHMPSGVYTVVTFDGPPSAPAALQDHLRLNKTAYRVIVERAA